MPTNEYGLDVDYFTKLCAREFNPSVIRNRRPDDLARALLRAARTACAAVMREEEFEWSQIRAAGEVRAGDKMRIYDARGNTCHFRVRQVLNPGDPEREEIVLNRQRNTHLPTRAILEQTSWAKRALIRNRPAED